MYLTVLGLSALAEATPHTLAGVKAAFESRKYMTASHELARLIPTLEGAEQAEAQLLLARTFANIGFEDAGAAVLRDAAAAEPDPAARAPYLDWLVQVRAEDLGEILTGATGEHPRAEAGLLEARRLAASGDLDGALGSLAVAVSVGPTCPEASALQGELLAAKGDAPEAAWTRACPPQAWHLGSHIATELARRQEADLLVHRAAAGDLEGAEALMKEVSRTEHRSRAEIALAEARWRSGDRRAGSSARKATAKADHWLPEGAVLAAEVAVAGCASSREDRLVEARDGLAVSDDAAAVQARLALDPDVRDGSVRLEFVAWQHEFLALNKPIWVEGPAGRLVSDALEARRGALEPRHDAAMERAAARLGEVRTALGARLATAEERSAACP